jgi:hypothetical protein
MILRGKREQEIFMLHTWEPKTLFPVFSAFVKGHPNDAGFHFKHVTYRQYLGRPLYEHLDDAFDFVDKEGRTYEAIGGGRQASQYFDWDEYRRAIDRHLLKEVDYLVFDLTDFTPEQIEMICNYINSLNLPNTIRDKIITLGFSLDRPG